MSFTAEQKSQLAKLLATENLTVEHQKISTAKFDTKNRVLYLPIWQNMTGVMYDLLVGHEVGHALYTPAEGWHDAVTDEDKNKNYKNFLNVVEDARIEKKVKRKYPGLNAAFRSAYAELTARDFFGINGRDVNEMAFIDRLNLFSKSQWSSTWIQFSAQEELLVKEVQAAETWDDVVRITDKVYQYSKEEQYEQQLEQYGAVMADYGDDEYDYDDDGDESDIDDQIEAEAGGSDEANDFTEDDKSQQGKGKSSPDEDSEEGTDETSNGKKIQHEKFSSPGDKDQFNPECETDENYRRNETQLLDDKCKEFVYVDIPKPNLKNIITPAKRVQQLMTEYYKKSVAEKWMSVGFPMEQLNKFKRRNERYIGLLAKEFEMRKAAKSFSKSKLSDTGDIDINKLSTYKFDDNIFRKVMLTPKGKNHGLVLLLDCSGSMSKNMAGSIEQILVLAMFCRKVNIPFVVYGFTENSEVRRMDLGIEDLEQRRDFGREYSSFDGKYTSFSNEIGEFRFDNVHLREYLNSQMSNAEFTNALKNMCCLMAAYGENGRCYRPDSESLHNTPMIQATVAVAEVMKEFKRKNNLDITSLVIVHDGDADHLNNYWVMEDKRNIQTGVIEKQKSIGYLSYDKKVFYLRDKQNKFEAKIDTYNHNLSTLTLQWFTKVTGCRAFGFFILPSGRGNATYNIRNRYFNNDGKTIWDIKAQVGNEAAYYLEKELLKRFKDEKYLASKTPGFEEFYFIRGGTELTTEDEDDFEVEGKFTAKKLATAFAKYNKKRAVNRVLVSRFIQGIAA